MVRRVAPEIVDIVDTTDHAAGEKPFYQRTAQQAAEKLISTVKPSCASRNYSICDRILTNVRTSRRTPITAG
jgi:hypothetical protein